MWARVGCDREQSLHRVRGYHASGGIEVEAENPLETSGLRDPSALVIEPNPGPAGDDSLEPSPFVIAAIGIAGLGAAIVLGVFAEAEASHARDAGSHLFGKK